MTSLIVIKTRMGDLSVYGDNAITGVDWGRAGISAPNEVLIEAKSQILNYFNGTLRSFSLPISPEGTQFQVRVWKGLTKVPYGETLTYGKFAKRLNTSPRAVGRACASNPIPLIIPCHRIIGRGGALVGYSGGDGIATKANLIIFEKETAQE